MLQIILGTIIAFLSITGVAELAKCVQEFLYMPPKGRVTLIAVAKGHDEGIEYLVRSLVVRARGFHPKEPPLIIVVDEGMDEETRAVCVKLAEEFGCIRMCGPQELPLMIETAGV